jgi:acyl-CoA thioester hydrolase
MSDKNWPIRTEIPVLWGDTDSFGHVNNIIYLKWCETSRVELFCKMWNIKNLNMDDVIENRGIGPILANFNSNYRIPVRYPDVIQIKTRITHIGNTSFGIEHEMYSKNNGSKIVFDAESVVVMVDYKNEGKVQLDSDSKKTLEAFV